MIEPVKNAERPRRFRILIVDTEPIIRSSLKTILQAKGYEVVTEATAERGLIVAQSWPPDVLIADIILTGMNGLDLAIELTGACPRCRIILLCAQVAQDLIARATDLGFDFLSKPVPPTVILDRLQVLLQSV